MQFVEDEGGESDTVNGLQVVNEVYRESGDTTERMQLQEEGQHRKDRAQEYQPSGIGLSRKNSGSRHQFNEKRDAKGQEEKTSNELVKQHGGAVLPYLFSRLDMRQRKDGISQRTKQTQSDAKPITHIQTEDEHDANDGNEADQKLLPRRLFSIEKHIQEGGEEAGGSDACHPD